MKFVVLGDIGRDGVYHVGDEAMAEVAVEMLDQRGVTDITLVATDPEVASAMYGYPAVPRIGFLAKWPVDDRERVLADLSTGDFSDDSTAGRLNAAIADADAVLIAGGGNMNAHFRHHLYERVAFTRLARTHAKPLIVTSQTIGPFLSARDRVLIGEVIDYAAEFGVRDDESYRLAVELGSSDSRIHRIDDDALLLPHADRVPLPASITRSYIVASFTSDPGKSGLDRHEYLDTVAALLDSLAVELDADVLLVPHVGSLKGPPMKGDELSDRSIVERSASGRITALAPVTAREVAALMAGCVLSVSTRYHPLVFGPNAGVPTIGIALSYYSSVRMRGALEPFGLAPFVIGAHAWDCVVPAARELTGRAEEYRNWVTPIAQEQRTQQDAWWDLVANHMNGMREYPAVPQTRQQFTPEGEWALRARQALANSDALELERAKSGQLARDLAAARGKIGSLRKRVRRGGESRRVARFTDRLRRVFGYAARAGRQQNHADAGGTDRLSPSLSVIIPVYNVEQYLARCLDSVLRQKHTDFEVILIDDASTDSSAAIAQTYADADRRIRFYRQENRGLGAVRNRGLTLAAGTYVMFVDSDDVIQRGSFQALTGSLKKSGSDVAVGGVERILPDGRGHTPEWVRDLHDRDRRVELADMPSLLRDFYTWNKAYRRAFFVKHGFQFRETLFEDQPLITELLISAKSIDVLAQTTYKWRIREDDSSLTGNMYSLPDIISRHKAVNLTAAALTRFGVAPAITHAWWWTLVEYHCPAYIKATAELPQAREYKAVVDMIAGIITADDVRQLDGVSAANRTLVYLALTATQADVAHYLAEGGSSASNVPLQRTNGQIEALLPSPDEFDLPADLYRIDAREHKLIALLTGHTWETEEQFTLHARIGISQLPADEPVKVDLFLRSTDGLNMIPLPHTGTYETVTHMPRPYGIGAWYTTRIPIDIGSMQRDHPAMLRDGGSVHIQARSSALDRSGPFNRRDPAFTATQLSGTALGRTNDAVALSWSRAGGITIRLHTREVVATSMVAAADQLSLELQTHSQSFDPVFILANARGKAERRFILRRTGPHTYSAKIDTDWLTPNDDAYLVALNDTGKRRNIHGSAQQHLSPDTGNTVAVNAAARILLTGAATSATQ